jgi:phage terminase small subunit
MALTDKQIRFCEEYLANGNNATQAAISAGYSEDTARSIASENLTKPDIKEYVNERQQQIAASLGINRDRVLREYARVAFSDIRKFYTVDGALKSIHDLDEDSAASLAGVETYEEKIAGDDGESISIGQTKKIKTYDKIKALDSIAKVLGYNSPDKIQQTTVNFNTEITKEEAKNINDVLESKV